MVAVGPVLASSPARSMSSTCIVCGISRAYVGGQGDAGSAHHDDARPTVAFDHIALDVDLRAARDVVADARVAFEYTIDHVDYLRQPGSWLARVPRGRGKCSALTVVGGVVSVEGDDVAAEAAALDIVAPACRQAASSLGSSRGAAGAAAGAPTGSAGAGSAGAAGASGRRGKAPYPMDIPATDAPPTSSRSNRDRAIPGANSEKLASLLLWIPTSPR